MTSISIKRLVAIGTATTACLLFGLGCQSDSTSSDSVSPSGAGDHPAGEHPSGSDSDHPAGGDHPSG